MANMSLSKAIIFVKALLHEREQIRFNADGADDKLCPSDDEWDAIEELLHAVEGEF